jgi:DNA-binding PadR family transcriptional regulator
VSNVLKNPILKEGLDKARRFLDYIRHGYIRQNDTGMKTIHSDQEDRLPLTPAVFHVLLTLSGGERHGYAIMQEVTETTDGQIKMGPGTLYGTIKRLLEAGLIEETDGSADSGGDDERRRYYRLTGVGQRVVEAEARRYSEVAKLVRRKGLIGKFSPAGGV